MSDRFIKQSNKDNPFKNDRGVFLVQSLFYDIKYDENTAMYCIKDQQSEKNGKVFKNLKELYMQCNDPTEYTFATTYLGGWQHWKAICNSPVLRHYIEQWREELEVKLRAQALCSIYEQATADKPSYQASKYIADREWIKRPAGAPSKEEIQHEKNKQTRINTEFQEHLERMKEYH